MKTASLAPLTALASSLAATGIVLAFPAALPVLAAPATVFLLLIAAGDYQGSRATYLRTRTLAGREVMPLAA